MNYSRLNCISFHCSDVSVGVPTFIIVGKLLSHKTNFSLNEYKYQQFCDTIHNMKRKKVLFLVAVGIIILITVFVILNRSNADITPNPQLSDRIGVFGLVNPEMAEDLRVGWTRYPIVWTEWEEFRNSGTLTPKIRALDRFRQRNPGVKIIITLDSNHPTKTKCFMDDPVFRQQHNITDKLYATFRPKANCPPKNLSEYKEYVRDIVTVGKDFVTAWQIGNEVFATPRWDTVFYNGPFDDPNEIDYLDEFNAAYTTIKEIDPNAVIVSPGINFHRSEFDNLLNHIQLSDPDEQEKWNNIAINFSKLIINNCNKIDMVDIHLYHTIASIPNRVKWTSKVLNESNCNKPIISTEIAGPNPIPGSTEFENYILNDSQFQADQANDLQTRITLALNNGIQATLWFYSQDLKTAQEIIDNYNDPEYSSASNILLSKFGLVEKDGDFKPAYYKLQTLASQGIGSTCKVFE